MQCADSADIPVDRLNGVLENNADHAKWERIRAARAQKAATPPSGLQAQLQKYLGPRPNVDLAALEKEYYARNT